LLRQRLQDEGIDLSEGWEEVIVKLMLQVAYNLNPDFGNGNFIDIRHYVKIKKIPGGTPQDSEYVHGVVCTKNLAHKKMPRVLPNPRILILKFALEYERAEGQFMSLDPVIAAEDSSLRKLVDRIRNHRPHLVLVEKSVARKALEFLLDDKINVTINVKPSVIEAVARCAGADIVTHVDKLALEPNLGKCGLFSVKTFAHELVPGHRKTYLYFENCQRELGCTIVLRGGDLQTLEKIKHITNLLVFAVYNLKLETALTDNQYAQPPPTPIDDDYNEKHEDDENSIGMEVDASGSMEKEHRTECLKPYESTILSISPFIKFPAPYLMRRMKDTERKLVKWTKNVDGLTADAVGNVEKSHQQPTADEVIAESKRTDIRIEHDHRMRAWASYSGIVAGSVNPYDHQNIVVLYSNVCTVTQAPCQGPEIHSIEYYSESDRTLGQFLEEMCNDASFLCPAKTCDRPLLMHCKSYCHGHARIEVAIEQLSCPLPGMEDRILLWSYCGKCRRGTQPSPMSDCTWKYSFGKYLELSIYQKDLRSRVESCPHSVYHDHIRYFCYKNLAVRFEYQDISLMEISTPSMRLHAKPEILIRLKKEDMDTIRTKIVQYWDSVTERIKNFNYDIVQPDKIEACKQDLKDMSHRVVFEYKQMLELLQRTYVSTSPVDTLSLTSVVVELQEKVMNWEKDFSDVARKYFRPRLTTRQLKRIFVERELVISRGHSGSLLNELPLVTMDFDDGPSPTGHFGPSIVPKLGTSPTTEEDRKNKAVRRTTDIDVLENDIEKVNALSLFPRVDPKVSRRLSIKLMKESKASDRPTSLLHTSPDTLFSSVAESLDESASRYLHEADDLLPHISSTIRRKPTSIPKTVNDNSENVRDRSSHVQPQSTHPFYYGAPVRSLKNSVPRGERLPRVPEKKEVRSLSHFSRWNKPTQISTSRAPEKSARLRKVIPFQEANSEGRTPLSRALENKRPLRKLKCRPAVLSSKPVIEVFNNVKEAFMEDSDSDSDSDYDSNNRDNDEEPSVFNVNKTDAFDESLGHEDLFPLLRREQVDTTFGNGSSFPFLGTDCDTPASLESVSIYPRPSDTMGTSTTAKVMKSLSNFWADRSVANMKPIEYPL
jgi:1-phosphatidylinositol-3-phosphate 5-kinase